LRVTYRNLTGLVRNTVQYVCQKYSPTDCFFGDFAHTYTIVVV